MSPEYTIHVPDALQREYQLLLKAKAEAEAFRDKVASDWKALQATHADDQKGATKNLSTINRRIGTLLARAQAATPTSPTV